MAQLNSRGTQTRNRWDYFEHSNGMAFVWGSVASGNIGVYFANNSRGSTALDIYAVNWSASVLGGWSLALLLPPLVLTPITPLQSYIAPLQPDAAQPPGTVGAYSANAGTTQTLVLYNAGTQSTQIAPIMGSYFTTLPPGWGLTIGGGAGSAGCAISMTVWYQYVSDNISPAR